METRKRIERPEYYMEMAKLTSYRSTCPKKAVGAILVKDGRVIATGYNGVLSGELHSKGIDSQGITHTVHAEANIISFCAKEGISTNEAILYTTLSPCEKCAELIIQSGIKEVVYLEPYRDVTGTFKLKNNRVKVQDYEFVAKPYLNKPFTDNVL